MCGAPRLGATSGQSMAWRQFVEFLENVFHGDALLKTRADNFAELRFDVVADNEHERAKTGAHRVENGIINDGFAARADGVNLFQPTVAAAHAGGENEQSWFSHMAGF